MKPPVLVPPVQAKVSHTPATPDKQTVPAAVVAQQINRAIPEDDMSAPLTIQTEPEDHMSALQTDMAATMDHMSAQKTDTAATMDHTFAPLAPQPDRASPPSHQSNNIATKDLQYEDLESTAQKYDNSGQPTPQSSALAATSKNLDSLIQQGPHCESTTSPANNKSDAPVRPTAMLVDHASFLAPTAHNPEVRKRRKTCKGQTLATTVPWNKKGQTISPNQRYRC
jgi:hypothetical protein